MITMEASFRALDAFISPSAAITYGQGKGEVRLEEPNGGVQQFSNWRCMQQVVCETSQGVCLSSVKEINCYIYVCISIYLIF